MCTPFDASAPQKVNYVFVTQPFPVTAAGGKRSAAGWNGLIYGSAYWCPWTGGAAQQELSAGGVGEDIIDLWFEFFCLLPQLIGIFPPLTFCFRSVPFLTLKIGKAPKAAPTTFYVPQQFLKLLPSSVFDLSLCYSLGGAVAALCPWSAATGNQVLAAWETLPPCCHAAPGVVGLPTNPQPSGKSLQLQCLLFRVLLPQERLLGG